MSEAPLASAPPRRRGAAISEKHRVFAEFDYAAGAWWQPRRVIVKAEHSPKGANPRCFMTHLPDDPKRLYERVYYAQGDMRTGSRNRHSVCSPTGRVALGWFHPFRLPLSSLAYAPLEGLRRSAWPAPSFCATPEGFGFCCSNLCKSLSVPNYWRPVNWLS